MYYYCNSLKTLSHNFNTDNVENMSGLFEATPLTSIDLSQFNTKKVIDMSRMFADCYFLKNLDLSSFNTEQVKNMPLMLIH